MERHDDNALIVYTDGSCLARPRRGGYAFRLVTTGEAGHEVVHDFGPLGRLGGTNNEMELVACIEALKEVAGKRPTVPPSSYSKVVLYTDSTYVYNHVSDAEMWWPLNGWMTRQGEPVRNRDLWEDLVRYKQKAGRVDFRKVKAHSNNPHNRAVDALAKKSARAAYQEMGSTRIVRGKTSPRQTEPGVVRMRGQTEVIRIVSKRNLARQPYHLYIRGGRPGQPGLRRGGRRLCPRRRRRAATEPRVRGPVSRRGPGALD